MRHCLLATLLLVSGILVAQEPQQPAQSQTPEPPAAQQPAEKPEEKPASPAQKKESPREHAWSILRIGAQHKSADRRSKSIGVLGLVPNNAEARKMAETGLNDNDAGVRAAAATALGEMGGKASVPALKAKLDDADNGVVLAVAKSLLQLHDNSGYDVYYAILTGKRKAKGSLIKEQMKILHDPKKLADIGIEEGLGFVPFAGMGYTAYKMLSKDEVSPVRAAAARELAKDPDPESGSALEDATSDKSWIVRKAAIDAIAKRNDPKLLSAVVPALEDDKDIVMYSAAAAVVHLTDSSQKRGTKKSR